MATASSHGRPPARSAPRRRQLRLTREGRYFVAISIGIGLAAINTGNNLLYLLLGWLLSMIIASGALSDLSLRGLAISRRAPPRVFANQPFLMEISIDNQKGRLASYSVEIEDLVAGSPLDKRCYFLKIPAGRSQRTAYRHTFTQRGLHRFDGFRVATRFPFTLFHKSRFYPHPGELLVYPEIRPLALPSPRGRSAGEVTGDRIGRQGEFFGLREFQDGDDRRAISWRSTARAGRLMVRELEEESQRRATVLIDNALPPAADRGQREALERAIGTAASLAATYIARGYAVRLASRGRTVPHAAGPAQLDRILRVLALLEPASDEIPLPLAGEPHGQSVLVTPRGLAAGAGPRGITHVIEA